MPLLLLRLLPVIIPVASALGTTLWTAAQDLIVAHPALTVTTGAIGAVINWLIRSPFDND